MSHESQLPFMIKRFRFTTMFYQKKHILAFRVVDFQAFFLITAVKLKKD